MICQKKTIWKPEDRLRQTMSGKSEMLGQLNYLRLRPSLQIRNYESSEN